MMLATSLALFLFATNSTARERGIAEFNQGHYAVAQEQLQQAAKVSSDSVAATFLALTQVALGNCQSAMPALMAHKNDADPSGRLAMLAAIKCAGVLGQNKNGSELI